ncbi:MAG: hypothetical protein ACRDTU_20495 [Micromonosporaceae bacterium]
MAHTSDNEGNGVRLHLTNLRSRLGSLQRLADAMRDELKKIDPSASNAVGNDTGVILHNAALLRTRNQRGLYAVEALIGDLEKTCRDLEAAGRKAGYLLETADDDAGRGIRDATGD